MQRTSKRCLRLLQALQTGRQSLSVLQLPSIQSGAMEDEYGPSTSYGSSFSLGTGSWSWPSLLQAVRTCAMPAAAIANATPLTSAVSSVTSSPVLPAGLSSDYERRLHELLAAQTKARTPRRLPKLDQIPMMEVPPKQQKAPVPPSHKQPLTWQQILELARRTYGSGPLTGEQVLTDTFR